MPTISKSTAIVNRFRDSAPKTLGYGSGRIFLLSPANVAGIRARLILNEYAEFELARRLRREGAPLGEVFSFSSGLYFRAGWARSHGDM